MIRKTIEDSDFIKFLKLLSKTEIAQFLKYVEFACMKQHKDIPVLINFLEKFHPKYEFKQLDGQTQLLLKREKYTRIRLIRLLSDSKKQLKNFIAHQQLIKNQPNSPFLWLYYLIDKDKDLNLFSAELEKEKKNLNTKTKFPIKDLVYFKAKHELYRLEYAYNIRTAKDGNKIDILEKKDKYSLNIFIIERLINYASFLNKKINIGVKNLFWQPPLTETVLKHLEEESFDSIVIKLWYQLVLLLQEPENKDHYKKFKQFTDEYLTKVKASKKEIKKQYLSELRQIHTSYINYYIKKARQKQPIYWRRVFKIYIDLLNTEIIFHRDFENIVSSVLRIKQDEWDLSLIKALNIPTEIPNSKEDFVRWFIKNYQNKLAVKHKKNTLNSCNAKLDFEVGNFEACNQKLFDFGDRGLSRKILQTMCYYEINKDLDKHLESFKRLLERHEKAKKLATYTFTSHKNFLKIVRQLDNYKGLALRSERKQKCEQLKEEMEMMQFLTEKTWLEEKLEALL